MVKDLKYREESAYNQNYSLRVKHKYLFVIRLKPIKNTMGFSLLLNLSIQLLISDLLF